MKWKERVWERVFVVMTVEEDWEYVVREREGSHSTKDKCWHVNVSEPSEKRFIQSIPEEAVYRTRADAELNLKKITADLAAEWRRTAIATRRKLDELDDAHVGELIAFELETYSTRSELYGY